VATSTFRVYYHTQETFDRTNRYLSLWAEYRDKSARMLRDKVPHEQIMRLYEETLSASGQPGDYRLSAKFATKHAADAFEATLSPDGVALD
jgi:hypothetical protein